MNHLQRPPPLGSGQKTLKGAHSAARGQSENATLTLTSGVFRESETETAAWSINRHTPPWRSLYCCCCSSRPSPQVRNFRSYPLLSLHKFISPIVSWKIPIFQTRAKYPHLLRIYTVRVHGVLASSLVLSRRIMLFFFFFGFRIRSFSRIFSLDDWFDEDDWLEQCQARIFFLSPFFSRNSRWLVPRRAFFVRRRFVLAFSFPWWKRRLRRPVHWKGNSRSLITHASLQDRSSFSIVSPSVIYSRFSRVYIKLRI